ncbi:MAG: arsenite methyltransferase [Candidatus Dormibacteria bacterium]
MTEPEADGDRLREAVRARYAAAAVAVAGGGRAAEVDAAPINPEPSGSPACGCGCTDGGDCCSAPADGDPLSDPHYSAEEMSQIPQRAVRASLGCGNPTALAGLRPGEVVLDLGSGGGIDVLLSARRVGPTGFAYGLDMTDEMLDLAESNAVEQGARNVRFLKGTIEMVPLADQSVDVVISNCVINLSSDKGRVLREAFRVLRPGGRLAVSDIVVQGELPPEVRHDLEMWVGCVAGAIKEDDYRTLLADAGFGGIEVEVTRDLSAEMLAPSAPHPGGPLAKAESGGGRVVSASVRARKPALP